MMNDSVNPNRIGDDPVGSTCMTTQSTPPSLAPKTAQRTSLGHRLQRALAGGPNRRLPGLHPSPGGAASLPSFLNRRLALPIVAILALLAAFLLPGSLLQAQDDGTIEYAENGTDPVKTYTAVDPEGAAVKWSLAGLDAGDFSIDGGVLAFKKSPNYEKATGGGPDDEHMANTYSVMVVATDATRKTSMKEVTVNVANVDEPGTVKLTTLAPRAGIELAASVTDPDGPAPVTGTVWQWAKSQNGTSGWGDIDKATLSTYTPADGDAGYYLRATVTYKDSESVRDTKTAEGVSANAVKAARSDNDAPEFTDEGDEAEENQATREVAENTAAGEAIGDPIVAEDENGDVLTYTLYDADGMDGDSAVFAIDRATGQLKTKGKLDFEDDDNMVYVVVVRATDADGRPEVAVDAIDTDNSDVITVTITVTDVDEAPDITGMAAIMSAENAAIDTNMNMYEATDPEETADPTLALTGADRGKFNFDESGDGRLLTFKAAPDYEKPGDADKDNVYEVTVEATDAVSNTGTKNVKITVTNVEEDGTVTMSQLQPRVGVAITASVTDLDGDVSNVTWQWSRDASAAGDFDDDIAKATSATYKPVKADADPNPMFLRATAMYSDGEGATTMDSNGVEVPKTANGTSANGVAVDTRNRAPVFDDQDDDTEGVQNDETTREVAENTAAPGNVNVGSPVTATDSDPNSDPLDYTLSGADAGFFSVGADNPDTADVDEGGQIMVKSGTKLDYETKQTYSVTLKAADSFGDYDTIDVTIMVTQVNEAPPVMGEATVEYAENGAGPVATYTAVDPEGAAVKWSLAVVDPVDDAGDFSISGGALSFKKSPDYEAPTGGGSAATDASNTYSVTVVATDATRRASSKVVTVNVTNVDEPGTVKLTTLAPRAGIALTASVTDPDSALADVTGPVWQWAKSRNGTSSWGDIDRAKSAIYTPADVDGGYYLRATVTYKDTESARDTKTAVGVSANKVKAARSENKAPVFPDQDLDAPEDQSEAAGRTVAENTAAGEAIGDPIVAEDDNNDVLTYTLYDADGDGMDGDSAVFAIDRATGQLKTKGKLDFEDDDNMVYVVVVRATDADGRPEVAVDAIDTDNSDVITVTITVTDVDEAPDITGMAAIMSAENAAIDTNMNMYEAADPEETADPTLALTGADRGKFNFDESGDGRLLTFKAAPDYEKPGDADKDNVYEVTVEATDAVSNTGTKNVKITVTNVEEDGTVTMSQLQPRVGVAITASVTDLDGDVSNVTWQWSRDASAAGDFDDDIAKATSATYKPVMGDFDPNPMFLRATAMYTDGFGEGESAMGVSANAVDEDTRNRAPVFDDQDDDTKGVQNDETTREVAENTEAAADADSDVANDNVGGPVTARDPDPNSDALDYTLSGADAALFTVRASGQIEVGAGTKLDYETKQTYSVTLKAADSFGDYDTIMVTIMVTPVNEAPVISVGGLAVTGQSAIEYAENGTGMVATYSAAGPDAARATWSLEGDDAGDFRISSAGVLTFRTTPNYEAPADAGTDNVYQVTVEANDGTNTATKAVTVMVTNVNEDGMVTLSSQTPVVGIALTASLTDADGEITGMKWQWASENTDGTFADIAGGATSDSYTPADADVGKRLRATASYTDGHGSGKRAMAESANAVSTTPTTVVDGYDADGSGTIDRAEVGQAVRDFIGRQIEHDDVVQVIAQYFKDLRSGS